MAQNSYIQSVYSNTQVNAIAAASTENQLFLKSVGGVVGLYKRDASGVTQAKVGGVPVVFTAE